MRAMISPLDKAYDPTDEPTMGPEDLYEPIEKITDVCVVCFSYKAMDYVRSHYECVPHHEIRATANAGLTIYYLPEFGVLFFMSLIGATNSGALLHEIAYIAGVTKFVYFGSCGVLDDSYRHKILIPTSCYREEGFSYHYAPPSEYMDIQNHEAVASFMKRQGVPYLLGKGWTTDGFYNETKKKVERLKSEGVLCVDMEVSGLQAIANHIRVDLYIFFFSGDVLGSTWKRGDLGGEEEKVKQISTAELALLFGKELTK